jgi:hypothetical protein
LTARRPKADLTGTGADGSGRIGAVADTTEHPFPPVVYAPTVTVPDEPVRLEMHHTGDGRVAIFVYSALDRLQEMYGPETPWVLLTVPELQAAHDEAPYDLLFLDRRIDRIGLDRIGSAGS